MRTSEFQRQLDERIGKYDLLCHPFYQAWSAGQLTREDLRAYAAEYYRHVAAFPEYLGDFAARLKPGPMQRAVLSNLADEEGRDSEAGGGTAHAELWLDFAEGMGGRREAVREGKGETVTPLMAHFRRAAGEAGAAEALATFYAYESQVPRVAQEKAKGLRERYGADEKACAYFTLHATADVHHANVWRGLLERCVEEDPACGERALAAAEEAAKALWAALDGMEADRLSRAA